MCRKSNESRQIIMTSLSYDDLEDMIMASVSACFRSFKNEMMGEQNIKGPKTREYLSTREAATYLRISVPTLRRKAKSGEIPSFSTGGKVLFVKEDLEKFLTPRTI